MKETQTVCLRIEFDPDFTDTPELWDFAAALDLDDNEGVAIVSPIRAAIDYCESRVTFDYSRAEFWRRLAGSLKKAEALQ